MRAGKLRHKLIIQSASSSTGAFGKGQSITYSTVATVNGEIRPLTGKEFVNAQANDSQATHEIRIRYYAGLTSRHRFLFGSRVFNIVQPPRNIEERNREMIMLCQEQS